jgi:thiosulfate/3-mercaptopyruvate sulfurtransferase
MFVRRRIAWVLCCAVVAILPQSLFAQRSADQTQPASALSQSQLIRPEELVKVLQSGKSKPLMLNVGPRMLYVQAHIPGAEFIGPGSGPEAIKQLRTRVQSLPHTMWIILYCGCCLWTHCPNVSPAYAELHKLGFTNVKVLYIADNLGTDWVYKGYPTILGKQ